MALTEEQRQRKNARGKARYQKRKEAMDSAAYYETGTLPQLPKDKRPSETPSERRARARQRYAEGKVLTGYWRKTGIFRNADEFWKVWRKLFARQKGRCNICGIPQSLLSRSLNLDHCHQTLMLRGLLCSTCNLRLSWYERNAEAIRLHLDLAEVESHIQAIYRHP